MNGSEVFADISEKYDRVNRILSLGRDEQWRSRAIAELPEGLVLDLGAGTGVANKMFGVRTVIAADPSPAMLARNPATSVLAVGERLPFADNVFDGVFSAFVFRNLTSIDATLQELKRTLKPNGKAVIVDASRPAGPWKRKLHQIGSALFVPLVGRLAGAVDEYRYLNRSLDKLPQPEELFASGPLAIEKLWRMGPLGFVYAAVLTNK